MALCAACGEPPREDAGPLPPTVHLTGVWEGTSDTPTGASVFMSLALGDGGSGLILIDAFRGFFDGPVTVTWRTGSLLAVSFADGEGRGMAGCFHVSGDTLSGTWGYGGEGHDISGSALLVFASDEIPPEEDFFARCHFVPGDFEIPRGFETGWCVVRRLTRSDAEAFYEAIMSSAGMLRRFSGGSWPPEGMTPGECLAELEMHELEHDARDAFTYAVVSPGGDSVLGCVYVMPPRPGTEAGAMVQFWLRTGIWDQGMDPVFMDALEDWICSEWPFRDVAYPGRERDGGP